MSNKISAGTKVLTKYGFVDIQDLEGQNVVFVNADGEEFTAAVGKSTKKENKDIVTLAYQSKLFTTPQVKTLECFEDQDVVTTDGTFAVNELKYKTISQAKMKNAKLEYSQELEDASLALMYQATAEPEKVATYEYENIISQTGKYVFADDNNEEAVLEKNATRLFTPERETWFVSKDKANINPEDALKNVSVFGKAYLFNKYIKAFKDEEDDCCFSVKEFVNFFDDDSIKEIYAVLGGWHIGNFGKKTKLPFFSHDGWKCSNVEPTGKDYSYYIDAANNSFVDTNGIIYKL